MADNKKLKLFRQLKQSTLGKEDLSLKGSIDEPIRPLVELINNDEYFYTTSTCSGRITITEKPVGESNIKRGNKFLYTSHAPATLDDLLGILDSHRTSCDKNEPNDSNERSETCLWFKFEPFIMHIQCYDLDKARSLLNLGLAAGCRNSGITLGKPDKFMLALRSTSSMEVPVFCDTRFQMPNSYIEFLYEESSRRMSDNAKRLTKLQDAIEVYLKHNHEVKEEDMCLKKTIS